MENVGKLKGSFKERWLSQYYLHGPMQSAYTLNHNSLIAKLEAYSFSTKALPTYIHS